DVSEVAHPAHECLAEWIVVRSSGPEVSDARGLVALLCARTPHLDREQQAGTTDQCNELTPCHVGHGPTSCRGVTTRNRRDPIVRSACRRAAGKSLGQTCIVLDRGEGGRPLTCLRPSSRIAHRYGPGCPLSHASRFSPSDRSAHRTPQPL